MIVIPMFSVSAKDVPMPEIRGITQWLNTDKPLTPQDLKGKVVLVDFWTYSCINCIRTFPHLVSWHEKYADQGLVIIGVHTPEFDFEKDPRNVKAAIAKHGIPYPVAMDNDYATWRAYSNRYWPAHYLADRQGIVRYTHFGEGNYAETEKKIVELLGHAAAKTNASPMDKDLSGIKSPEIYLGHQRLAALGNKEKVIPDQVRNFRAPDSVKLNKFYLSGDWRIAKEFAALESDKGKIIVRYHADKANMVLGAKDGRDVTAEIYIDGKPAQAQNKGTDVQLVDGKAVCRIGPYRLYNLTHTKDGGPHTLEIRFLSPGVKAFTFTFG